ncbi:DUF6531 domain-containing protein [Pseudomonas sp. 2FE]|uniref:DUF6531 domain-containing protein n=1 Tax=Pseudomonas sp. 2FE TaxID=2502190 RepID=UPI0021150342|nr:DUF6531 domain-containing protein [Pseudomonas sp. 2FE]
MNKSLHHIRLFALDRLSEAQQIANRGLSLITKACSKYLLAFVAVFSMLQGAIAMAGSITVEPKRTYTFPGWDNRPIITDTLEGIVSYINSWQENRFNVCIAKPTYGCDKALVTSTTPGPGSGMINGEPSYYSLNRTVFYQTKRVSGGAIERGSYPINGALGAGVTWTCPAPYGKFPRTVGPNALIYECVLPGRDIGEHKGAPPSSCDSAQPPSSYTGNPINFSVGNKFQEELDFQTSGTYPLTFSRAYNSLDGLWRHNYSTNLEFGQNKIYLTRADGRMSYFTVQNGIATAEPTELGSLAKISTNWLYTAPNNDSFVFSSSGRLLLQKDPSGLERKLTYVGGAVTVTDSFGRSLTFTEDAYKQPLSLKSGAVKATYSYNSNKRLVQFELSSGGEVRRRSYHYEDSRDLNLLTGITDERGIRFATWAYDDKGRAISSEHAGGAERKTIVYNSDGSRTVTNELGKTTTYRFVTIEGAKRITAIEGEPSANCPNSNSTFTYDARGLLKTKTDNKGFVTTYDYNERGLEVARTEASGTPQARTITTTWHAALNLPLTVTEPGRMTTYTYDAQGRQTGQTSTAL